MIHPCGGILSMKTSLEVLLTGGMKSICFELVLHCLGIFHCLYYLFVVRHHPDCHLVNVPGLVPMEPDACFCVSQLFPLGLLSFMGCNMFNYLGHSTLALQHLNLFHTTRRCCHTLGGGSVYT